MTAPQYARIEQPFGVEAPIVHCPICGKAQLVMVDDAPEVAPCTHLAFIHVGEIDDYEFQSADFMARLQALGDAEADRDGLQETLARAGYGSHLLALEITYGGMACGPVWATDVYGFDYNTLK